jgi:hypothetical protein
MKKSKHRQHQTLSRRWRRWGYKNILLFVLSLILLFLVAGMPEFDSFIKHLGTLGYLGAFVTGIFFVSTFTVAPAIVVLFHLANVLQPYEVALLAGAGAMIGDLIIFRYVRDEVFYEVKPLLAKLHLTKRPKKSRIGLLMRSPYFAWLLPVVGAIIIASPFPDEVGVSMLGASRIKQWQMLLLTFALNAVGIFVVVSIART